MYSEVSPNTQAMLLLTAPLITGKGGGENPLLKPGEYKLLARMLRDNEAEPADLMGPAGADLLQRMPATLEPARISRLLNRGFQLSQAIERWSARAIWVISRADAEYPKRYKRRMREDAPIVLYGVGDRRLLNQGGLAVVGSRDASQSATEHAQHVGQLAAAADVSIISGGARGIDQTAMSAALAEGGRAVGVLADSLERAALERSSRDALMNHCLVLTSPFDPSARFQVGHAMQRNKLIYALADLALVEESDYNRGGTWTGAVEQLEKLRYVPVFLRDDHEQSRGLSVLVRKGGVRWPELKSASELLQLIDKVGESSAAAGTYQMALDEVPVQSANSDATMVRESIPALANDEPEQTDLTPCIPSSTSTKSMSDPSAVKTSPLADELYQFVQSLARRMSEPQQEKEIALSWGVTPKQAKDWIEKLVKDGTLARSGRPSRYCSRSQTLPLLPEEPGLTNVYPNESKSSKP